MRQDEVLEQIKPHCEVVSITKQGVLIKLKTEVASNPMVLTRIYDQVKGIGGSWTPTTRSFFIPREAVPQEEERLADLPLSALIAGPQPRFRLDNSSLIELMADIKQNGLKDRIRVRPSPVFSGKFEVVDGHRRVRAFEKLGKTVIPVIITQMGDQEAYESAYTINDRRNGFDDYEKGRWFKLLMEKFPEAYPNQREVGKRFGINQPTVARLIKYYEVQEKLREKARKAAEEAAVSAKNNMMPRGIMEKKGSEPAPSGPSREEVKAPVPSPLSEGVERYIRTAPPEEQDRIRQEAREKALTVEQTRQLVEAAKYPLAYEGVAEVIASFPEKLQSKLRKAASIERLTPEQTKQLGDYLTIPAFDAEKALAKMRENYQKQVQAEEAKRRTLVQDMQDFYSGVVDATVERMPPLDNRQLGEKSGELRITCDCTRCRNKVTLEYGEENEDLKALTEKALEHFGRLSPKKFSMILRMVAGKEHAKIVELGLLDEILRDVEAEIN